MVPLKELRTWAVKAFNELRHADLNACCGVLQMISAWLYMYIKFYLSILIFLLDQEDKGPLLFVGLGELKGAQTYALVEGFHR